MQLLKAVVSTEPEISNEELLMLENEFLRNELELKEIENSIEIYECILDCIEKTGGVDKSLEVMFGENVSSSENFEAEIRAQYESACESYVQELKAYREQFMKHSASLRSAVLAAEKKLVEAAKTKSSKDLGFPVEMTVASFIVNDDLFDKIYDLVGAKDENILDNVSKVKELISKTEKIAMQAIGNFGSYCRNVGSCIMTLTDMAKVYKMGESAADKEAKIARVRLMLLRLLERKIIEHGRNLIMVANKMASK